MKNISKLAPLIPLWSRVVLAVIGLMLSAYVGAVGTAVGSTAWSGEVHEIPVVSSRDGIETMSWHKQEIKIANWNATISKTYIPDYAPVATCGSTGTVAFLTKAYGGEMRFALLNLRSGNNRLYQMSAKDRVVMNGLPRDFGSSGFEPIQVACNASASQLLIALRSPASNSSNDVTVHLLVDIDKGTFFTVGEGTIHKKQVSFGGQWISPFFTSLIADTEHVHLLRKNGLSTILPSAITKDEKVFLDSNNAPSKYIFFGRKSVFLIRSEENNLFGNIKNPNSNMRTLVQMSEDGNEVLSKCAIKTSKILNLQPATNGLLLTVANPRSPKQFQPVLAFPDASSGVCDIRRIGRWRTSPYELWLDGYVDIGMGIIRASHPLIAEYAKSISTQFALLTQADEDQLLFSLEHEFRGRDENANLSWRALDMPSENEATLLYGPFGNNSVLVHFWKQ